MPLRREFYAATLIATLPLALDSTEDWVSGGTLAPDSVWTAAAALGVALFTVFRFVKKRTQVWRRA